jgi:hypothetical protein
LDSIKKPRNAMLTSKIGLGEAQLFASASLAAFAAARASLASSLWGDQGSFAAFAAYLAAFADLAVSVIEWDCASAFASVLLAFPFSYRFSPPTFFKKI